MQGENKERWMELCAQAVVEQDPRKLFELAKEINYLLEEEERRLGGNHRALMIAVTIRFCRGPAKTIVLHVIPARELIF